MDVDERSRDLALMGKTTGKARSRERSSESGSRNLVYSGVNDQKSVHKNRVLFFRKAVYRFANDCNDVGSCQTRDY